MTLPYNWAEKSNTEFYNFHIKVSTIYEIVSLNELCTPIVLKTLYT